MKQMKIENDNLINIVLESALDEGQKALRKTKENTQQPMKISHDNVVECVGKIYKNLKKYKHKTTEPAERSKTKNE